MSEPIKVTVTELLDALAAMTRERDEWKDAKHRCEDLAEEHIQRIESLQGALEECEKCIADFFVPGLDVGELDRARLALGRARVALGRQ